MANRTVSDRIFYQIEEIESSYYTLHIFLYLYNIAITVLMFSIYNSVDVIMTVSLTHKEVVVRCRNVPQCSPPAFQSPYVFFSLFAVFFSPPPTFARTPFHSRAVTNETKIKCKWKFIAVGDRRRFRTFKYFINFLLLFASLPPRASWFPRASGEYR